MTFINSIFYHNLRNQLKQNKNIIKITFTNATQQFLIIHVNRILQKIGLLSHFIYIALILVTFVLQFQCENKVFFFLYSYCHFFKDPLNYRDDTLILELNLFFYQLNGVPLLYGRTCPDGYLNKKLGIFSLLYVHIGDYSTTFEVC